VQFPNLSPTHCPSVTDLRHRSSSVTDLRLYLAIGIIGATVMPHNLYLHSALVQSRKLQKDEPSIRSAIRFNGIDSIVALTIAFFVNAAILGLAATVFL
jgi:manganese transport protein